MTFRELIELMPQHRETEHSQSPGGAVRRATKDS